MTEVTYAKSVSAHVSFYKQTKDTDAIDLYIKPTSSDPSVNMEKVFGGAGMGVIGSVVYLSGEISFMRMPSLRFK